MKIYLFNPESGAPVKKWWDGQNYWSLPVGECAMFPIAVGKALKEIYGFLQELSPEEFEVQLAKLEKEEPPKIKVDVEGKLIPKTEEDLKEDKEKVEVKKKEVKKLKEKVAKAKDAEPDNPQYWEMSRGELINEVRKRELEVKGLGSKKVYVSKEQLINTLENDDLSKK